MHELLNCKSRNGCNNNNLKKVVRRHPTDEVSPRRLPEPGEEVLRDVPGRVHPVAVKVVLLRQVGDPPVEQVVDGRVGLVEVRQEVEPAVLHLLLVVVVLDGAELVEVLRLVERGELAEVVRVGAGVGVAGVLQVKRKEMPFSPRKI